ncbi:MAG: UDP-glucose 4-epimerase GalE, partial [Ruminococcus sp.]|nr:UDP-glucose 4-epimerase GalE [Candidatus Copronaster equi]
PESLKRIKELTGKDFRFYECDIRNREGLDKIFAENSIDAVIHFAGLKSVGESVEKPLEYYENNIGGTITLCEAMKAAGCKKLVFSSSATVYGTENSSPLKEDMKIGGTTNPYGTTKYMIELILQDLVISDPEWSVTILRYFNPIGAHESGRIGENPNGIPNNIMPYITQVAVGKLECLNVFGDDYDTHDGTGVRDYIHVVDLALGHIKAVEKVASCTGVNIYNLGTGTGYSVFDLIKAFEKASGTKVNYKIAPRRIGDLAECYSDPSKAEKELGWVAQRNIDKMCEDSWRWQKNNPKGY